MPVPAIDGAERRGGSTEPEAARNAAKPGGFQVHVNRQGVVVSLSLVAVDEYAAVELYEHFVQALEKGQLNLQLK